MAAKLLEFLKTGSLGPVVLGMNPSEVVEHIGDPDQESQKKNPLTLKYGSLQLVFWRHGSKSQLRNIALNFLPKFEKLPPTVALTDFRPRDDTKPSEGYFRNFIRHARYLPVQMTKQESGQPMVFLSGVVVDFADGLLNSIRISQKENTESTRAPLSDEREPSKEQILDMIEESERALELDARRSALVIGWAALEASLRRVALLKAQRSGIGVQPTVLISELLSAGVLFREDSRFLEEVRQLRTAIVHGLAPVSFSPRMVREMNAMSRRLLANTGSG
jgi:hypothetical protein